MRIPGDDIPGDTSLKDLDLSLLSLISFRKLISEHAKALEPWKLPTQTFIDILGKHRPSYVSCFEPRAVWAEPTNLIELAQAHLKTEQILLPYEAKLLPDLIFVPGLAFDKAGRRLGHGKGHYDQYISGLKAKGHKFTSIGVIHSTYLFEQLPSHFFHQGDQNVDFVFTQDNLFNTIRNEVLL